MDKLKVFLSWSGSWSKEVAEALRDWLPDVLQFVQPWISSGDIDKGRRWASEIAQELETSRVGIICLTPDNLASRWILFEAGALSKTTENTFVCTFLHGLTKADLAPPLSQFQATEAYKEDTRQLIDTINRASEALALTQDQCTRAFERWWPELEARLNGILEKHVAGNEQKPSRSDRDILEEILQLSRSLRQDATLPEVYGILSHELRTPVNAILGYTSLLRDGVYGPLDDRLAIVIKRIGDAALHQLELLNEVFLEPGMTPQKFMAAIEEMQRRYGTESSERRQDR
jgi:TIR domain/His Kinase A (phospho-acceptor) domain